MITECIGITAMKNRIKISISSEGAGISLNKELNPIQRQLLEERMIKLCMGLYTVDAEGNCLISSDSISKLLSYKDMAVNKNEVCVSEKQKGSATDIELEVNFD